jgi:3-oxoacyl-[acyl-carrier-protein] synthase III
MPGSNIAFQVLGTGEYRPGRWVSSEEFDRRWGKNAGWTFERTGVAERAFAAEGDDIVAMGTAAARRALESANIQGTELDAIIAVGSVPAQAIPCTAVFLQRALNLAGSGIPAFDVNATCLGFLAALDLVAQAIATGRYRRVLIVASELASAGLNWDDPSTAGLFGDGAAAVVVGAPRTVGAVLLASHLQTYSEGAEYCQVRAGGTQLHPRQHPDQFLAGTFFEMSGRPLYRLAAELLPGFLNTLLDRAGISAEDVDVWIPHQASGLAIGHLQAALSIPAEKLVLTLRTHGNQISASLPVALHHGIANGRVHNGDVVALIGSGAGVSFGGVILRY